MSGVVNLCPGCPGLHTSHRIFFRNCLDFLIKPTESYRWSPSQSGTAGQPRGTLFAWWCDRQGMRIGMTPHKPSPVVPLVESPGSFPHSLLSTSKRAVLCSVNSICSCNSLVPVFLPVPILTCSVAPLFPFSFGGLPH